MKTLFTSMLVVFSLVLWTAVASAAGDKGNKNGNSNSNSNGNGNGNGGNANSNTSGQPKIADRSGKENQNQSTNSDSNQKNSSSVLKLNQSDKVKNGQGNNSDHKMNLGDSGFDKHGIGKLDEKKFADQKDNKWRYQHRGNDWWYWQPNGYWMYWHDGNWARYNPDTYIEVSPVVSANGPYYEDQSGFFLLQGNRKIYDPQIRREASPPGAMPGPPQG